MSWLKHRLVVLTLLGCILGHGSPIPARCHGAPLTVGIYLYAHADPVNRIDPSGHRSAFNRADAAAIGREVHRRIGEDFVSKRRPFGITGSSVHTIRGLPNPAPRDRLFPDLVDLEFKEVYEIKPLSIGGTASGAVQLGNYVLALNLLDPTGGWGVAIGPLHYNSAQILLIPRPLAIVTVFPPAFGLIYYHAQTLQGFALGGAQNVARINTSRIGQTLGISTLNTLLLGF